MTEFYPLRHQACVALRSERPSLFSWIDAGLHPTFESSRCQSDGPCYPWTILCRFFHPGWIGDHLSNFFGIRNRVKYFIHTRFPPLNEKRALIKLTKPLLLFFGCHANSFLSNLFIKEKDLFAPLTFQLPARSGQGRLRPWT